MNRPQWFRFIFFFFEFGSGLSDSEMNQILVRRWSHKSIIFQSELLTKFIYFGLKSVSQMFFLYLETRYFFMVVRLNFIILWIKFFKLGSERTKITSAPFVWLPDPRRRGWRLKSKGKSKRKVQREWLTEREREQWSK